MARRCTVCSHPKHAKIDEGLARNALREVAANFSLTLSALSRHYHAHFGPGLGRKSPAAASQSLLVERSQALYSLGLQILKNPDRIADLGLSQDHAALAILEKTSKPHNLQHSGVSRFENVSVHSRFNSRYSRFFDLRYIHRFPIQTRRRRSRRRGDPGRPPRRASLVPIVITSGQEPNLSSTGSHGVPKRDPITNLITLLELGCLRIQPTLPARRTRVSTVGHTSDGAPSGDHDDLICALWPAATGLPSRAPEPQLRSSHLPIPGSRLPGFGIPSAAGCTGPRASATLESTMKRRAFLTAVLLLSTPAAFPAQWDPKLGIHVT